MSDESRALSSAAAAGDRDALAKLVAQHLPALRVYLRTHAAQVLRDFATESDLVQSVCIEALEALDQIEWRGEAQFRLWMFTAAKRKLVEKHRYLTAEKRDVKRLAPHAADAGGDDVLLAALADVATPSEIAVSRETARRLQQSMDRLPEESREVVMMSRLMGLSHREIAEHLGKTEVAVRSTLSRALARLALDANVGPVGGRDSRP